MTDASDAEVPGRGGVVTRAAGGDAWRVMMTDGAVVEVMVRAGQCVVMRGTA